MQKYVEFVFVNAPHDIVDDSDDTELETVSPATTTDEDAKSNGVYKETDRSWWFNKEDNTFKGTNKNGPAYGFDESFRLVEEVWRTQGPFHGLLGFSQGACFVGLICNLSMRGSKFPTSNLSSAVHSDIDFYYLPVSLAPSDRDQATVCHTRIWLSIRQFSTFKLL